MILLQRSLCFSVKYRYPQYSSKNSEANASDFLINLYTNWKILDISDFLVDTLHSSDVICHRQISSLLCKKLMSYMCWTDLHINTSLLALEKWILRMLFYYFILLFYCILICFYFLNPVVTFCVLSIYLLFYYFYSFVFLSFMTCMPFLT